MRKEEKKREEEKARKRMKYDLNITRAGRIRCLEDDHITRRFLVVFKVD
jgi:hypothetical protein